MSESQTQTNGIGFCGLLTIVLITLKLIGIVQWPWLWVLFPLWGGFVFVLVLFFFAILVAAVSAAV